jgi:hypothetical protein
MRGTSSLRYRAPVAMTTEAAVTEVPSSSPTVYWPSSGRMDLASAGTANRAPNFRAWMTARSPSSAPEMPDGNPR